MSSLTLGAWCGWAQTLPAGRGNVTLLNLKLETRRLSEYSSLVDVIVHGQIRNDSALPIRAVTLMVSLYGRYGESLKTCNSGYDCAISMFHFIKPGEVVSLENGVMNRFSLDASQFIASAEWSVKNITYAVAYAVEAGNVVDASYQVTAQFDQYGLALQLRNTSTEFIEVVWDQSVYVDEDGNTSRLIRGNVKLLDKDRPQPNTTIPPGAKTQETVFPVTHVDAAKDGSGWKQRPLLAELMRFDYGSSTPTTDVPDVTGEELKVYLRLLVGDQKRNVPITFKILAMSK